MNGLVKKTVQGVAVLGILGLGSCDPGNITRYSGRELGNIEGIDYAEGRGEGRSERNTTWYCGRKIPHRMIPDSVTRDTVIAEVIFAGNVFSDVSYTGIITSPPDQAFEKSASTKYPGTKDTLRVNVVVTNRMVADTIEVDYIHSLDTEQKCLVNSGRDTLHYDLIITDELIVQELDVDIIR